MICKNCQCVSGEDQFARGKDGKFDTSTCLKCSARPARRTKAPKTP